MTNINYPDDNLTVIPILATKDIIGLQDAETSSNVDVTLAASSNVIIQFQDALQLGQGSNEPFFRITESNSQVLIQTKDSNFDINSLGILNEDYRRSCIQERTMV